LSSKTETDIALEKVEEISPSSKLVALCGYGPAVYGKPGSWHGLDLMAICEEYHEGVRSHRRLIGKNEARYLIVDKELFESDVNKGALGDFLTDKLLYPFNALHNADYLNQFALRFHSRVIREEVRNLVFEYGEMSRGLVATPEFYPLARMRLRARIFMPSMNEYTRLLDPTVRERNLAELRESFMRAAISLRNEVVELDGNELTIPDNLVDKLIRNKGSRQAVNIIQQSQRAVNSYLTRGRAVFMSLDLVARELYSSLRLQVDQLADAKPEDPKNLLFVRTASGLASVNERTSLEETVAKIRPGRPVTVVPLAGVLNEVFLITSGKERFVAKKFTDWHSFKWFTLNLVSFGSKFFSVSGKARMTNEYGINRYLSKKRLSVPEIIQISLNERLLIENYVPGISLDKLVADMVNGTALSSPQLRIAEQLGETLSRIHEVGVTVGDSKPENFVANDNEIYTIDLEQGGKKGDYAWDIAELLYYSGHYSRSPTPSRGLVELIAAFIRGYSRHGAKPELRRAAGVRYMKVFSIWTPTPVLLEISKMLREK
jgi:tRNA A-37 threonylcarbamoyl transferase component Bud32